MLRCNTCGEDFSRADTLTRHRKRKYPCVRKNQEIQLNNSDRGVISGHTGYKSHEIMKIPKYDTNLSKKKDIIPTLDGDEFIGKKPLTPETSIWICWMLSKKKEKR